MFKKGDIIEHHYSGKLKKVVTNLKKSYINFYNVVNIPNLKSSYDECDVFDLSQEYLEENYNLYKRSFSKVRRLQ